MLSGGELAAAVVIDAVTRLLPGVLGDESSHVEDSFTAGLLDCPQYTRPEVADERAGAARCCSAAITRRSGAGG